MRSAWVKTVTALLGDDSGQTMAEYGLMAAVLGVAMIAAVGVLQNQSGAVLSSTATGLVGLAQNPP